MSVSKSSRPFLESPRHPLVQQLRRLMKKPSERREQGRFVIESLRLVEDALRARIPLEALLVQMERAEGGSVDERTGRLIEAAEDAGARVYWCSPRVTGALAQTEHPQGIVAVVAGWKPGLPPLESLTPPVVLVEGVQDPGNVGSLIRVAAASGAGAVVLDASSADLLNPKVIRATAGALFRIPAGRVGPDDGGLVEVARRLRAEGWAVMALDPRRGTEYFEEALTGKVALAVGSEGSGLSQEMAGRCTHFLRIPMAAEVESLNVATAASVVLFEAARQRHRSEPGGSTGNARRL